MNEASNEGATATTSDGNSRGRTPNITTEFAAVMSQKAARQVTQMGYEGVAPGTLMSRKMLLAWRRLNDIDEQLFTRQAWVASAPQDYAAHAQRMGDVLKQMESIIEDGLRVLGRPRRPRQPAQASRPAEGVELK